MDWDEMRIFFRGPSIDAFYQIAVHFGLSGFKGVEFYLRKVLYEDCIFRPDPLTNIAATGNYFF
jgi:hypothetical protein